MANEKRRLVLPVALAALSILSQALAADDVAAPFPLGGMQTAFDKVQKGMYAPDACSAETINEFGVRRNEPGTINGGDACGGGNFYNFVCENTKTNSRILNRRKVADFNYEVYEAMGVIENMPDGPDKAIVKEALAEFQAKGVKGYDGNRFAAFLVSQKKSMSAVSAYTETLTKKSKESHESMYKLMKKPGGPIAKARDVFESIQNQMITSVLEKQENATIKALYSKSPKDDYQIEFVKAAYKRMRLAVSNVEFNESAADDLCFRNEKNTIVTRPSSPTGKMQIVMCPGSLLADNVGEIAGSIARAMGHAIDPCALDSMTVGNPAVSLAGLHEPLRSCVAGKVGIPDNNPKNVLPRFNPTSPVPDSGAYLNSAMKSSLGFATMPGSPHCPAPFTQGELNQIVKVAPEDPKKMTDISGSSAGVPQRDQSNEAVAQFYGNKALKEFLNSDPLVQSENKKELGREAFAPYCEANNLAKGSHPSPERMLNKIVGTDAELKGAICGGQAKKNGDTAAANAQKSADAFLLGKEPADSDYRAASCDAMVGAGFAKYVKGFDLQLAAGARKPNKFDVTDINDASASSNNNGQGGGGGSSVPSPASDYKPEVLTDFKGASAEQLAKRLEGIEYIRDSLNQDCVDTSFNDASVAAQACGGRKSGMGWGVLKSHSVPVGGGVSYDYECQTGCRCDTGKCNFGEIVFRGQKPPVEPAPENPATVEADALHLIRRDEDAGDKSRYQLVGKECWTVGPSSQSAEVTQACSKDNSGEVTLPEKRAVTFLGEASGKMLTFGCQYKCACPGNSSYTGCQPYVSGPSNVTVADPAVAAATVAGQNPAANYLGPKAVVVDLTQSSSKGEAQGGTKETLRLTAVPSDPKNGYLDPEKGSEYTLKDWAEWRKKTHSDFTATCQQRCFTWLKGEGKGLNKCPDGRNSPPIYLEGDHSKNGVDTVKAGFESTKDGKADFKTYAHEFDYACKWDCSSQFPTCLAELRGYRTVNGKLPAEPEVVTGREKALRADFEAQRPDAELTCSTWPRAAKGADHDQVISAIKSACETKQPSFLEGKTHVIKRGDLTKGPVPFRCQIDIDFKNAADVKSCCESFKCKTTPVLLKPINPYDKLNKYKPDPYDTDPEKEKQAPAPTAGPASAPAPVPAPGPAGGGAGGVAVTNAPMKPDPEGVKTSPGDEKPEDAPEKPEPPKKKQVTITPTGTDVKQGPKPSTPEFKTITTGLDEMPVSPDVRAQAIKQCAVDEKVKGWIKTYESNDGAGKGCKAAGQLPAAIGSVLTDETVDVANGNATYTFQCGYTCNCAKAGLAHCEYKGSIADPKSLKLVKKKEPVDAALTAPIFTKEDEKREKEKSALLASQKNACDPAKNKQFDKDEINAISKAAVDKCAEATGSSSYKYNTAATVDLPVSGVVASKTTDGVKYDLGCTAKVTCVKKAAKSQPIVTSTKYAPAAYEPVLASNDCPVKGVLKPGQLESQCEDYGLEGVVSVPGAMVGVSDLVSGLACEYTCPCSAGGRCDLVGSPGAKTATKPIPKKPEKPVAPPAKPAVATKAKAPETTADGCPDEREFNLQVPNIEKDTDREFADHDFGLNYCKNAGKKAGQKASEPYVYAPDKKKPKEKCSYDCVCGSYNKDTKEAVANKVFCTLRP